jgi:1-acyl-sn-glycerol-3-phosphate acyltransferase
MADQKYIEALLKFYRVLREYHQHEVQGSENIPKKGKGLIVFNHSLATYDTFLLLAHIYLENERLVRPLVDRLFFKIPYLGEIMNALGAQQGSPDTAETLLRGGNLVSVAPGGMIEAIRPSHNRYQIRWEARKGFAKIAVQTGSPVILSACPKADDIYDVLPSKITEWAYEHFRVPIFFAKGLGGLTPIPKPVHLVHFIGKPMKPPKVALSDPGFSAVVDEFHAKVVQEMEALMVQGVSYRHYKR